MESIRHWVEVLGALWLCMLLIFFAISGFKSPKADRGSQFFLIATFAIVLPIIQNSGHIGKPGLGELTWGFPFVSYFGFFLFFLGIALNWLGILTLRKQWSVIVVVSDSHKLVDTGIYKFIRHPIYTALLLEVLGFGVALSNWVSLLLLLIPNLASLTYRIFVEEKELEKHFGNDYIKYEQRTKRLIPGLF